MSHWRSGNARMDVAHAVVCVLTKVFWVKRQALVPTKTDCKSAYGIIVNTVTKHRVSQLSRYALLQQNFCDRSPVNGKNKVGVITNNPIRPNFEWIGVSNGSALRWVSDLLSDPSHITRATPVRSCVIKAKVPAPAVNPMRHSIFFF